MVNIDILSNFQIKNMEFLHHLLCKSDDMIGSMQKPFVKIPNPAVDELEKLLKERLPDLPIERPVMIRNYYLTTI